MSDIQTSAEVSELYGAWAAAQAEITAVDQNRTVEVRMKTGGKYSYSYATLAQILHTIREPLTKNGLWYTQYVRAGEMITRVFHKSGEWMETGVIPMPDIKGAPADIGGIISFFKRYSLSEAMGLATEEDNSAEQGDDRQVSFLMVSLLRRGRGRTANGLGRLVARSSGGGEDARDAGRVDGPPANELALHRPPAPRR